MVLGLRRTQRTRCLRAAIAVVALLSANWINPAVSADVQKNAAQEVFAEGFAAWQAGKWQEAVDTFKLGLGIYPKSPVAHYYMAKALEKLGQTQKAFAHFKVAAKIGPNTKEGVIAAAIVKRREMARLKEQKRQEEERRKKVATVIVKYQEMARLREQERKKEEPCLSG